MHLTLTYLSHSASMQVISLDMPDKYYNLHKYYSQQSYGVILHCEMPQDSYISWVSNSNVDIMLLGLLIKDNDFLLETTSATFVYRRTTDFVVANLSPPHRINQRFSVCLDIENDSIAEIYRYLASKNNLVKAK